MTNWNSPVHLRTFTATPALPVISEIDLAGQAIEITNPGDQLVDVSDWELQALNDYGTGVAPNARLRFPAGTVVPPRSAVVWTSRGVPPGAFPEFVSAKPFNAPSMFRLARLLDASGRIVDEVYARAMVSAPADAFWKGTGLANFPTNVTFQRVGYANHFRSVDWATNSPTRGSINASLILPWTEAGLWTSVSPSTVQVSNGVWTGSIILPQGSYGTNTLIADNGAGVSGKSAQFNVISKPALNLEITAELQFSTEANPGVSGNVTISVPANVLSNLVVTLSLSDSNEFRAPSQVIIPAGANVAQFAVTNVDDALADGAGHVVLVASATGYASATAVLVNADDEAGSLTLIAPTVLKEDSGFVPEPGWVFVSSAASHDVLVTLTAEAPLEVPAQVIIPAGRVSQSFPIRVGDDLLVNPPGWTPAIRATTATWPEAEAGILISDDENGGFNIVVPLVVVEGTPAIGQIQVNAAHAADTVFTLTSNHPRLQVPGQVLLPAGATNVDFAIAVPDNLQPDAQGIPQLCVQKAGLASICRPITVADDEVDLRRLVFSTIREAVFSGEPFPVTARLVNAQGTSQRTNVAGEIALLADPTVAQLTQVTNPISFVNGDWSNHIVVEGEALDVRLAISAAGYQTNSSQFDILKGRQVAVSFTDAVWHGGLGRFLIAEPSSTNGPARLTEIDPLTGERGRSLNLPRTVRRIALSDDGAVAWLASMQSTLQRVNLADWQFDREVPVDTGTTNSDPRDLVVLPGEPERVVVVANINNTGWRVILFDHGIGFTNRAALPGSIATLALLSGRHSGEVFCQAFGFLSRFLVTSNAVTLGYSTNISSSSIEWPTLDLSDGRLYRGSGEVYDPDTLENLGTFATLDSVAGCPFPDHGAMLFVERNNFLKRYDLDTFTGDFSHSLPPAVGMPRRLMRWSARGLASFTVAGTNLVIFETPLVSTNAPNLVVTANAPEFAILPNHPGLPVTFSWQFSVTNHGSSPALGVQLQLTSGERFDLGTMAPGEGAVVGLERGSFYAQVIQAQATARSATPDAVPEDNTALAVTRVKRPDLPSSKQLILGMTHLIVSPDGNRLYASVARSAGEIEDGVAVIDPAAASITQMLPLGSNPQRLAISDDGNRLYALLGTNTIVRWNLAAGTNELTLVLTNESILDFVALPGSTTSVVVATTTRVAIFDDGQPRPGQFSNPIGRRYAGFASGLLWIAEPGQLRPFTVNTTGLNPEAPTAFSLFSDYYRFASDGRYLYFSGAVFDTVSRLKVNSSFMGDHFYPDVAGGSLFSPVGANLRNYSLSNYTLRAEQWLAQATDSSMLDPVRWGSDGLAVRVGQQQLIMTRSAVVPSNVAGDLAVVLIPPAVPLPYETLEWTVILTNRSSQPAPRTMLTMSWGDIRDIEIDGPVSLQNPWGFVSDLEDMPPHGSATYTIRGWTFSANVAVSANVLWAGNDATPADNSASVNLYITFVSADHAVHSVSGPASVTVGDEFQVTFVYTNAGPGTMTATMLQLVGNAAVEFLGVAGGAYPTNENGPLLGTVAPGESKTVVLRYRAKEAGLLPISAYAQGQANDPDFGNNLGGIMVYAAPATTNQLITELVFPGTLFAWDRSRQQLLATFPDNAWTLHILDPATLEPLGSVPLPDLPSAIVPCNNGRHAWVPLAGGSAVRVDLDALSVDHQFQYNPEPGPFWGAAAPPGQSNILLVAIDPGWLGNARVQVFDNGVPRPATHGGLGWMGGGCSIHFTPDGRLFVATSYHLRELQIVPGGLQEIGNFDSLGEYDRNSLTSVSNRLFFVGGRVVNLQPAGADNPFGYVNSLVADSETGCGFCSRSGWASGSALALECFDAHTLAPIWKLPVTPPIGGSVGGILTMGTNGVLVLGDKLRIIKTPMLEPPAAELRVTLNTPPVVQMPNLDFPIELSVTNASVWAATGAKVNIALNDQLVFSATSPGAGTNVLTVDLGPLNGSTNITLSARALTNGSFNVQASVSSSLADPDTLNNSEAATVAVLLPPMFLMDDIAIAEGSSGRQATLTAWLSRPAPTNLSVNLSVSLLTAQVNDFSSTTGQLQFIPGQRKLTFSYLITPDSTPELDETALLALSSSNLLLSRTSVVVTILNDDWPQITVTNLTVNEGNSGRTSATLRATLSAKAPFPVEVLFHTAPITAGENVDYVPRSGWLRFAPDENMKTVVVPVLGDTNYEPSETAAFVLLDKTNADFLTAQAILTIRNDDLPPRPFVTVNRIAQGGLRLDFDTVFAATYQLQTTTNLASGTWKEAGASVIGNGEPAFLVLPEPTDPRTFYRLRAQ